MKRGLALLALLLLVGCEPDYHEVGAEVVFIAKEKSSAWGCVNEEPLRTFQDDHGHVWTTCMPLKLGARATAFCNGMHQRL